MCIGLEYMDGGSLATLLQLVGSVPDAVVAAIAYQLTRALFHLHRHARMHRDLKLSNCLLSSSGAVKLCDFGVATTLGTVLRAADSVLGGLSTMSPERMQHQLYSTSADMWSLGVLIWQLATGKYPFDDALNDHIPDSCTRSSHSAASAPGAILRADLLEPVLAARQLFGLSAEQYAAAKHASSPTASPSSSLEEAEAAAREAAAAPDATPASIASSAGFSLIGLAEAIVRQPTPQLWMQPLPPRYGQAKWDADLCAVLQACLQKHPDDRPSAQALLQYPYFAKHGLHHLKDAARVVQTWIAETRASLTADPPAVP